MPEAKKYMSKCQFFDDIPPFIMTYLLFLHPKLDIMIYRTLPAEEFNDLD